MAYAEDTAVPLERSKAEVELMLKRFGSSEFGYASSERADQVAFCLGGRFYRMTLPRPDPKDPRICLTKGGRLRSRQDLQLALEQRWRAQWRALCLHIKARIVAIESGITSLEREFLPDLVLPNRLTAQEWLLPQVAECYQEGRMPQSLLDGPRQAKLTGPSPRTEAVQ